MVTLVALAVAALGAPSAQADYEQSSLHFGVSGEAEQLSKSTAAAVNESGIGLPGAEAGALYVVGRKNRVLRYALGKEGEEPSFREAWGWGVGSSSEGAPESGYQRCGPALTTELAQGTFHTCKPVPAVPGFGGEQTGNFEALSGVAVDQATGYVYVRNTTAIGRREHHLIEIFTAMGEPVVNGSGEDGFGDAGRVSPAPPESIDEGPEKLHQITTFEGAIAVDESGIAYVNDSDYSGVADEHSRVMSFKPCNIGEFDSYCYTGQGHDIRSSSGQPYSKISLVAGGDLVTANQELIREYSPGKGSTPICSLPVAGQLEAMAANPDTGEIFYFTFSGRSIHRLGRCNEDTGGFETLQEAVKPTPETGEMFALAVNPSVVWGPLRPPGALYGVDYASHGAQKGIGDIFVPAEVLLPTVESETVSGTGTASATLRATINPHGFTTRYHFQYLSEAAYLANGEGFAGPVAPGVAPAAGEGTLGSSGSGLAAAAISGLSPGTAYRFRVVASSQCEGEGEPPCVTTGESAAFRTYATALAIPPDGRAYELVSPAEKNGGEVFPADPSLFSCLGLSCKPPGTIITSVFPMQSTPNGEAVAYMGYAFSGREGASVFNSYISRRTPGGWQTAAMSPNLLATKGGEDMAFDQGLSLGTIRQVNPPLSPYAPAGYREIYLQDAGSPAALTPLLTSPPPHRGVNNFVLEYFGATADFSGQFFSANDGLTGATPFAPAPPDPGSTGRDLYEWSGTQLALVNVGPGNASVITGASFASASPDVHGVSTNGQRVFWESGSTVYVREGRQITREVEHPGRFLTASADGVHVLLSDGCLYSLLTEACTELSQGKGEFQGIAGQSEDLSRIYFVDNAVLPELLSEGKDERGQKAQASKPNLYAYQAGAGTSFIATLATSDGVGGENLNDWASDPGQRTAEASSDGSFLAFASTEQLTGHDNVGPCKTKFNVSKSEYEVIQASCTEVFLYDAGSKRLTCASCNPTGEAPLGNSTLRRIDDARSWQPQARYMTSSGRLFFDSQDRLSPRDTNGKVEDVYEAEPAGVGSCVESAGCVSLISPGTGAVDSNFLAADESGNDVFFTTREQLVPADTDSLIDLYDAREPHVPGEPVGYFASETESSPSPCQGEACQDAQQQTPAVSGPGTAGYQGPGNLAPGPQRCAKGDFKKNEKCVKRKHSKQHKKHVKKKKRKKNVQKGGRR